MDLDICQGKIRSILNDTTKFKKLDFPEEKLLDKILKIESNVKTALEPLKKNNTISEAIFNKITPTGSQPGKMYGLYKVHKRVSDGCPPFRPILSAINTPTYQLAKFLIPLLEPITKND